MPVQTQEAAEVLRLAQHHGLHLAIYENPYYQAGIEISKAKVPLNEDDMINIPQQTCGEPGPSNKSREGLRPQLIHSGSIVRKGRAAWKYRISWGNLTHETLKKLNISKHAVVYIEIHVFQF